MEGPRTSETTKKCPFCAEIILAEAKKCKHCGEFLDASTKPRPAQKSSGQFVPENKLWEGGPSPRHYLVFYILGGLLFVSGPVVCIVMQETIEPVGLLLLFWAFGLMVIIWAVLDKTTRVYIVTNREVVQKAGIVFRETNSVSIRDIRVLNVTEDGLERLLGLGTVEVGSAGTAGIEVTFGGIENVKEVRDLIAKTREELS